MNRPEGYNPLRWNCTDKGCYNETLRPRIEEFAVCLPGKIAFSDVDGIVEVAGKFLMLEWKAKGGAITTGQRIMFERLTALSRKITVIVVCGHPREMRIDTVQVFLGGKSGPVEPSTLEQLKARIFAWADRAQQSRIRPSKRESAHHHRENAT